MSTEDGGATASEGSGSGSAAKETVNKSARSDKITRPPEHQQPLMAAIFPYVGTASP
jgi:hypothetical protein